MKSMDALFDEKELYPGITKTIQKFEKFVEVYDPLSLISILARDPYNPLFALVTDGYSEPLLEYLMSLALAKAYPKTAKQPNKNHREELYKLWKHLRFAVPIYFSAKTRRKKTNAELRFNLINRYLNVRGDAYIQHLDLTFFDLFNSHSQHLQEVVGFSAWDLKDFFNRIKDTIGSAIKKQMGESTDFQFSYEVFEILPENETELLILDALSCRFGDNHEFLGEKTEWSGWPTNDTIITSKPIIEYKGRYFAFHLPMMVRGCRFYCEELLKQKSERYYKKKYLPSRNKYLEHTAMNLINTLLPQSTIYRNLFYYVNDNGEKKQYELDGLVICDDCLIIVESKAGQLRLPSKRGHLVKFKKDLKGILQKAHEQATRAIGYINSASEVLFFDKKNSSYANISRADYKHIFIILVNFEPLYELSTHLSTAQQLGLLSDGEWPWFVYLNDLRTIAEINVHPSTFLHYIKKRIALNEKVRLYSFDELDFFMCYLKNGLSFTEDEIKSHGITMIGKFTEELDSYYLALELEFSEIQKPAIEIQATLELLLTQLETEQSRDFLSPCFHLLDHDNTKRESIGKLIEWCEKSATESEQSKIAKFRIGNIGIVLGCMKTSENWEIEILETSNRYLKAKKLNAVYAICWSPPLSSGNIQTFSISRK